MSQSNNNTTYATYQPETGSVYGLGATPEAARQDAARWADGLEGLATVPCSEALAERVRENGGEGLAITLESGVLVLDGPALPYDGGEITGYCEACGMVVRRLIGHRHGDGSVDTDESPVWLAVMDLSSYIREHGQEAADNLPEVHCGCND